MRALLFSCALLLALPTTVAKTADIPDRAASSQPALLAPAVASPQASKMPAQTDKPQGKPATAVQEKNKISPVPEQTAPAGSSTLTDQQPPTPNAKPIEPDTGYAVPPLLAAAVNNRWIAWQQASFYLNIYPFLKRLRPVTATPPLLAGIRPEHIAASSEKTEPQIVVRSMLTRKLTQQEDQYKSSNALGALSSLVDLQKNIKQQMNIITKKQTATTSKAEKQVLQEELTKLDKQLTDTAADFERIATGVSPKVFDDKEKVSFSWKDELTVLFEPSIKELKQLTAKARERTALKETIRTYDQQLAEAQSAVAHLNKLIGETGDSDVMAYLSELLPAWQNAAKRIDSKLDLARKELTRLEDKNAVPRGTPESSGNSMRDFFRNRAWYLLVSLFVFVIVLLALRLFARLIFAVIPGARREHRPLYVRILDIFFKIFSMAAAICGLIFVLYIAEDWLLLSLALILLLGAAWAVRQTLPKMWKHVRLVLNMGSIREGERVFYNGVPWRVETINVFCKLHNPVLGVSLRIPIENMIGIISRPYHPDEPWFPCRRGDWIAIDGNPLAKVVSLSHEQVEVVEAGGRRVTYQTSNFLNKSPANLSSNFSLKVIVNLSYDLQAEITTTVLVTLKAFLQGKLEEHDYAKNCLDLSVDFLQANSSSLDVAILADFKGELAPSYRRLERALAKWSVDCCNANGWQIPYPQMDVHLAKESGTRA